MLMEKLTINTTRLLIRNLQPSDLNDFYVYRCDPEVTKYQGFDVMTIAAAGIFIYEQQNKLFGEPGEWVQYGIENKAICKIIGDCAIRLSGHESLLAEIGITISPLYQKQGYAKEVLASILNFLFQEGRVHRVTETVDAENVASINLLRSLGFRQEGHFIENIFFKGKWGSEYQFAMLKKEWNAAH
jgi:ribosomal-protein-alanine N-acetyltransferase